MNILGNPPLPPEEFQIFMTYVVALVTDCYFSCPSSPLTSSQCPKTYRAAFSLEQKSRVVSAMCGEISTV